MLLRYLLTIFNVAIVASLLLIFGLAFLFYRYGQDLPDYKQLVDYEHPVATRVHAANGQLLAEYAKERRAFVPVDAMPNRVVNAFLSAEDKNFFKHPGIDAKGVIRAIKNNIYDAIEGCDVLIIMTPWQQFKKIDPNKVKSLMRGNFIIDPFNVFNTNLPKINQLKYFSLGKNLVNCM